MVPSKQLVCVECQAGYFGWGLVCGAVCRRKRRARQIRASRILAGTYYGTSTEQYRAGCAKYGQAYTKLSNPRGVPPTGRRKQLQSEKPKSRVNKLAGVVPRNLSPGGVIFSDGRTPAR
jgi:hypothetical protein